MLCAEDPMPALGSDGGGLSDMDDASSSCSGGGGAVPDSFFKMSPVCSGASSPGAASDGDARKEGRFDLDDDHKVDDEDERKGVSENDSSTAEHLAHLEMLKGFNNNNTTVNNNNKRSMVNVLKKLSTKTAAAADRVPKRPLSPLLDGQKLETNG